MRDLILSEIRRLADTIGRPPGKKAFTQATGITEGQWSGVFWARWSDALAEAGYQANDWQQKLDNSFVLRKMAEACRHYGHLPTVNEMKLYRLRDPEFPSKGAVTNHFGTQAGLASALLEWCRENESYADVATMLPLPVSEPLASAKRPTNSLEGWVYLIKSGAHYKIGRSDEIERRMKEIRIALPEAASLIHAIRTDDPAGIEAYWHRRFADRRANGEWFKLSTNDVAAFVKRKYQ